MTCFGVVFLLPSVFGVHWTSWLWGFIIFIKFGNFLPSFLPVFFSFAPLSPPPPEICLTCRLDCLKLYHNSVVLCFCFLFFVFSSGLHFWILSSPVSSSLLIVLSAMSNLLLIPTSMFFISRSRIWVFLSSISLGFFFYFCFCLMGYNLSANLSGRYRDFPYTPPSPHMHSLPPYQHPHQSGAFDTVDELTLTHHYHPQSTVYIRVHSSGYIFCGFAQTYNDMCPPW